MKILDRIKKWYYGPSIRMIEDFREKFPGKCFICSMYRYQRRDLGIYEPVPKHPGCLEGNGEGSE